MGLIEAEKYGGQPFQKSQKPARNLYIVGARKIAEDSVNVKRIQNTALSQFWLPTE